MLTLIIRWLVCLSIACIFLLPIAMTIVSSLMCVDELEVVYGSVHHFRWIPYEITLGSYWRLLFESQTFLSTFWNSMLISISSTVLQVLVASIVGCALARVNFRGKKMLLCLYIIVMLTPFQVTLLPNYLMSKAMGIYNSWWALILPNTFSPLGVYLMHEFIKDFPGEICEAAYMDTSSNLRIIFSIIMPNVLAGIITIAVLAFAESWNMVEQPLILLESEWLYPLSLRLSTLTSESMDIHFSGAVLYMIPAILIYAFSRDELIEGVKHIRL